MRASVQLLAVLLGTLFCLEAVASDTIVVYKDPRIDVLSQMQAEVNKYTAMLTSSGKYRGFRVQVISTRKRDDAFAAKTKLLSSFPNQKAYVIYQSPNFKVRIGNFLKKEEAEAFRKLLADMFPQGVYIVDDAIDYTAPDDEELIIQ